MTRQSMMMTTMMNPTATDEMMMEDYAVLSRTMGDIHNNSNNDNNSNDHNGIMNGASNDQTRMTTRSFRRNVVNDKRRRNFHNKLALGMTLFSVVLLITLSVMFGDHGITQQQQEPQDDTSWQQRWLEDAAADDDDNNDNSGDYSRFSCQYIYEKTPTPGSVGQCQFAKTCNGGKGIMFSWMFCSKKFNLYTIFAILTPFLLIWMITLFRLLGSTAEDYFSPALEMFSVKLGLPPRFAGVSLLALGNGAADVSATMSAIVSDEENGYKLALGALTGAAMLVGGVISGVVVLVAGGVPCRGALIRDVTALIVTVLAVWSTVATGEIGPSAISMFLTLYIVFVVLVLVADVYHRAVVLPRMAAAADNQELQRQMSVERQVNEAAGVSPTDAPPGTAAGNGLQPPQQQQQTQLPGPSTFSRVITAISNYDNPSQTPAGAGGADPAGGWGVDSDQLEQDRPIVLHGQNGILNDTPNRQGGSVPSSPARDDSGAYALVEDSMDQVCIAPNTGSYSAANWSGAWEDAKQELRDHASQVWDDIYFDADVPVLDKFFLTCELPFTFMRKITVPIPCEGYYNRATVALAMVVSPLWFAYYIYDGHGVNMFGPGVIFYFLGFWIITIIIAAVIIRYAPGGEGHMSLVVATPIALYGFCIAATWIDFVADHLVSLLNLMGIVLHIPGTIMGLTVLAWGNSMGDLSANLTMARKGLANMAMTACFAGPIFNILMGLGLGFSSLAANTGKAETAVALSPSVITGFVFILMNSVSIVVCGLAFGKGRIKPYYGYVALTMYIIYVSSSIGIQFSKYGDD